MNTGLHILAVEDDEAIRDLLSRIFQNEGAQARVVGTIREFRERLAIDDPTICIVDIGLPDGDGLSLVSELRMAGDRGVVVLTGRSSELDQVLGLELGADDYIVKPFRQRELLARVKAVARRLRGNTPAPAQPESNTRMKRVVHGYDIDVGARLVRAPDGQEVDLTTAEFDVLAVLVSHRGQAVSRDDIVKEVKGAAWHASERTIDGLVSRLRKKLPMHLTGKSFIKTLHGIGYMVTPDHL